MNNYFRKNASMLGQRGIFAPRPDLYRPYSRDFIWGRGVYFKQQREMLELIECPSDYLGICLSNNQALSSKDGLFRDGEFLYWTEPRIEKLATLFSDHRIVFLLEIENFATFVPRHLMAQAPDDIEGIADWGVEDFVWSDVVEAIQAASPDAEVILIPTEGMVRKFDEATAAITTKACQPRQTELQRLTKEQIETFQIAIGAGMSIPLAPALSKTLETKLGWTQETRIALSRQYFSEILRLGHSNHIIM